MNLFYFILGVVGLALVIWSGAIGRRLRRSRESQLDVTNDLKFGAVPGWLGITWRDLIYALAMVLGILAKEIWDNINENGVLDVRMPRLIAALLVSPIVYAAVYSTIVQDRVTLLGLALNFQNGFFWQAVFRTAQAGSEK